MSAGFAIPLEQAQAPNAGGSNDTPIPTGSWKGVIESTNVRPFPDFVAQNIRDGRNTGYENADGQILSIQIGQTTPLEGQESYGNRKVFVDFVLRDGERTLDTVDTTERGVAHWQLQKSARMVGNLALALDQVTRAEVNGAQVVMVNDGFIAALMDESFNGQEVGFNITHNYSKKTEKNYPEVDAFFDASEV